MFSMSSFSYEELDEKLTIASIDLFIRERNMCHLIDSFIGNKVYFYLRKEIKLVFCSSSEF